MTTRVPPRSPVPIYHVQRRAAFGPGRVADPPGPFGDTNTLVPFPDTSATNALNFYRVRMGGYDYGGWKPTLTNCSPSKPPPA